MDEDWANRRRIGPMGKDWAKRGRRHWQQEGGLAQQGGEEFGQWEDEGLGNTGDQDWANRS